jgi:DNA end-binding protein Ku
MKLAKQVIATFDAELNLKDYKDEYTEGLRKIIDAKIAGEEVVAGPVEEPAKVVDLMEALRRSLDSVSTTKKKTAKVLEVKGQRSKVKGTEVKGTEVKGAKAGGIKKVASR